MSDLAQKKVADLVSENINTAHVFKKHGIDFCCGGGISVEKACEKGDVNLIDLLNELETSKGNKDRKYDYNNWKLDFLVDHIKNIHHTYVLESLPILMEYADKVASVHGHHYTQLHKIKELVHLADEDLRSHLQKEENILFPYTKYLVQIKEDNQPYKQPAFGSVENPLAVMRKEHDLAGDLFKEIRKLAENYQTPVDACNTFKALYDGLEEFEEDLHLHIHLENNILFPKAILLEDERKKME